jgi:hypothetical protein
MSKLFLGNFFLFLITIALLGCTGIPAGNGFGPSNGATENSPNSPSNGIENSSPPSNNTEGNNFPSSGGGNSPNAEANNIQIADTTSPVMAPKEDGVIITSNGKLTSISPIISPKEDGTDVTKGQYSLFRFLFGPEFNQVSDNDPNSTAEPPALTLSSEGILDLKLLVQKSDSSIVRSYNAHDHLIGTYVRIIFEPEGKTSATSFQYRDTTVEKVQPEGYNVYFPHLPLGNGKLYVYAAGNKPSGYYDDQDSLISFPDEKTYQAYLRNSNSFVSYLGKFKIEHF